MAAAAATGVLSLYGTAALADSNAQAAAHGSPGVLSGNSVQVPVHIPVNVCGDSVDVAAALNPAFGNFCANAGHKHHSAPPTGYGDDDSGGYGSSETTAPSSYGHEPSPSPSYGSSESTPPSSYGHEPTPSPSYGDETTPPPSYGNETTSPPSYGDESTPSPSYGDDTTPPPYGGGETTSPPETTPPPGHPSLPHTGGNARAMIATSAASAALIAAGAVLYRRGRSTARR
ncbi:chaplin [Streptomyces sp. SCPE 10]|uniref:chaplin n=1 Tax=Streptomyces sp. SCPE 10 TaxID=3449273 RepID=UPI003F8034A0